MMADERKKKPKSDYINEAYYPFSFFRYVRYNIKLYYTRCSPMLATLFEPES